MRRKVMRALDKGTIESVIIATVTRRPTTVIGLFSGRELATLKLAELSFRFGASLFRNVERFKTQ